METTPVGIIYTADTLETMFFLGVMAAQNKRKALFFAFLGLIKTESPQQCSTLHSNTEESGQSAN